jgi:acyl carrier protein
MKKSEVLKIISEALGQKVTERSNVKNTKRWDSLGHLQILALLDKRTKGKSSKINKLSTTNSIKEIIKLLCN